MVRITYFIGMHPIETQYPNIQSGKTPNETMFIGRLNISAENKELANLINNRTKNIPKDPLELKIMGYDMPQSLVKESIKNETIKEYVATKLGLPLENLNSLKFESSSDERFVKVKMDFNGINCAIESAKSKLNSSASKDEYATPKENANSIRATDNTFVIQPLSENLGFFVNAIKSSMQEFTSGSAQEKDQLDAIKKIETQYPNIQSGMTPNENMFIGRFDISNLELQKLIAEKQISRMEDPSDEKIVRLKSSNMLPPNRFLEIIKDDTIKEYIAVKLGLPLENLDSLKLEQSQDPRFVKVKMDYKGTAVPAISLAS